MKRQIAGLVSALLLVGPSAANAQSSSGLAPDAGAGKRRGAVCFACHGTQGVSAIPGVPNLGGQNRMYLEKALRAYRDGQRKDPAMTEMAKPLSEADIANISSYFNLQSRMNQR